MNTQGSERPAPPRTGPELLDLMRDMFKLFTVQQTEHHYVALALYCAYTHISGARDFAPRLVITSAEKRCGKSRTLEILGELVARPEVAANTTAASLFLAIMEDPENPPTIILDEADRTFGTKVKAEQNEDITALLNAGFRPGMPFNRANWVTKKRESYSTFAPAILAGIGTLPDTIVDRAVVVRLRRRRKDEVVEPYRLRQAAQLHKLRCSVAEWAESIRDRAAEYLPESDFDDREADVWEPLLTIADLAGGHWPTSARASAAHLVAEAAGTAATEVSEGIELLGDLRGALSLLKSDRIPTASLLDLLRGIEDSRWKEQDLTGHRLARLLKPYGIAPQRSNSQRHYMRAEFEDAFARYLPTEDPAAEG